MTRWLTDRINTLDRMIGCLIDHYDVMWAIEQRDEMEETRAAWTTFCDRLPYSEETL